MELKTCRIERKRPDLPPSLTTPALINLIPSTIPPQPPDLAPCPQYSESPGGYVMDVTATWWQRILKVCAKSLQLCPILCNPMDCSLPGSSVHGISPGKNSGLGWLLVGNKRNIDHGWLQLFLFFFFHLKHFIMLIFNNFFLLHTKSMTIGKTSVEKQTGKKSPFKDFISQY